MDVLLEFEKPIISLEKRIADLKELADTQGVDLQSEITTLQAKARDLIAEIYGQLTPWQRVQVSRHPQRPQFRDYVGHVFSGYLELHGDRTFGDDRALTGGTAYFEVRDGTNTTTVPVMLLGQQKGKSTKERLEHNFGMPKPEGYRKAIRLMELANRAQMPVIHFIDTPGAYPGIETEERGQAQAIAESIRAGFALDVPVIAIVIGEGGSGGALAIGVANRVLMLEHSVYSVISPEACASILWSDASLAEKAAAVLKMSPQDLQRLEVIDEIVPEPVGGAHRSWAETFVNVRAVLSRELVALGALSGKAGGRGFSKGLREARLAKFRSMGSVALGQASLR